jgi:hypothetical protein
VTMKRVRRCRLVGNMYDGWTGEFVDTGQSEAVFGLAEGRRFFVYTRSRERGDRVEFRFSPRKTAAVMRDLGYDQDAINVVLNSDSPRAARTVASTNPEELRREARVKHEASVEQRGEGWVLIVDGEVVDERESVTDASDAKAWVEAVCCNQEAS